MRARASGQWDRVRGDQARCVCILEQGGRQPRPRQGVGFVGEIWVRDDSTRQGKANSECRNESACDGRERHGLVERERENTLTTIIPLFLTIIRRIQDLGGTMINPILHHTTVSNNKITLIKDSLRLSRQLKLKPSCKLHTRPCQHPTRSSAPSRN